jgi:hypothetical protein
MRSVKKLSIISKENKIISEEETILGASYLASPIAKYLDHLGHEY